MDALDIIIAFSYPRNSISDAAAVTATAASADWMLPPSELLSLDDFPGVCSGSGSYLMLVDEPAMCSWGTFTLHWIGTLGRNSTLTKSRRLNLVLNQFGHI